MPDDRLTNVLRVFEEALARESSDRAAYLDAACGKDVELRQDVERLLGRQSLPPGFLETPAWTDARPRLERGTRLGAYEIERFIGAGGMGEVYQARDTRLDRTVAIKVLPSAVSADPERRARFEREAKTVAGLNHPHICVLHDVGEHQGAVFLVMEHLAGQTLAERLQKGPLPLGQSLAIAAQIAGALSAAHRHGVIHRDLKPGNVMLTGSGAKLLDFGLAKLARPGEGDPAHLAAAPTPPLTGERAILGTLEYMAPEQLEGRPADARTDIWALGGIIYEMVAGKRAFEGESAASLAAAILEHDPAPLASLQPLAPPALDRIVRECLAKDPEARWQSAADLARELGRLAEGPAGPVSAPHPSASRQRRQLPLRSAALVVIGLCAGAAGALLWRGAGAATTPAPVSRLQLLLPDDLSPPTNPAISPDGRTVAFRSSDGKGRTRVYVRRIGDGTPTALEGTEDAENLCFSPDGAWIALASRRGIRRVHASGGPSVPVFDAERGRPIHPRISWTASGDILFSDMWLGGAIWRVPSSGGPARQLWPPDRRRPDVRYRSPQMLTDGPILLFTEVRGTTVPEAAVMAVRLPNGKATTVVPRGADARYLPEAGHVVYLDEGHLFGAPFDAARLRLAETPSALQRDVGARTTAEVIQPQASTFDVSQAGTLVYTSPRRPILLWKDRSGSEAALRVDLPGEIIFVSLSPAGRRAAVTVRTTTGIRPYLVDLHAQELTLTPFTDGAADYFGTFTCDGKRLLFTVGIDGGRAGHNIFSLPTATLAEPRRQTESAHTQRASSFACPGDTFLYNDYPEAGSAGDIWQQRLDRPETARPVVTGPGSQQEGAFSPDGRWIAYDSDAAGDDEIFVQGYPDGQRIRVSSGGLRPVWNPMGGELFYNTGYTVWSLPMVNGRPQGPPTRVFDRANDTRLRDWDVSPDGRRFLVAGGIRPHHINIVVNWLEELKAKVPLAR